MRGILKSPYKRGLKEYTLEKINLKEKPKIRHYLKEFFQNPSKYFNSQFDNKILIIGKTKTLSEKFEVPIPRKFQRRRNRIKTRMVNLDHNESLTEKINSFNEKRRGFKGIIESSLKEGQRYINDKEINEIFKAFKKVHEINKNKIKDFITTKELIDSIYVYNEDKNKNKNKKKISSPELTKKNLLDKISRSKSSASIVSRDLESTKNVQNYNPQLILFDIKHNVNKNNSKPIKRLKSSLSQQDYQFRSDITNKVIPKILLQNNKLSNANNNQIIKSEIYNSIDNNSGFNSQKSSIGKNKKNRPKSLFHKFISTSNMFKDNIENIENLEKLEKEKIKIKLLENEKLKEKQNQYLPNTNQKLIKEEIAKRLASQEKALMFNIQVKNNENNLLDALSKKLKKQKSELMLGQIEDHRMTNNIKTKLCKLIRKTTPGQNYIWEQDLRNSKREDENCSKNNNDNITNYKNKCRLNKNEEITRNPCYRTFYSINSKFRSQDKEYLKKKVSKTLYNKFMKEIKNLKNNYDGFLIEGQSLLKYEHDLIKKIKGKKIINNYESTTNVNETNDELYADNFDINKFTKY